MIAIKPFTSFSDRPDLFEKMSQLDQEVLLATGPSYDENAWGVKEFSYPLPEKEKLSFGVLKDEDLIGFSIAYAFKPDWHHISRVAIHPNQTGLGIGKQLLTLQIQEMLKLSPEIISVDTKRSNLAAIKLYESFNFQILQGQELETYVKLRNRETGEYLGESATHFALLRKVAPNFKFKLS